MVCGFCQNIRTFFGTWRESNLPAMQLTYQALGVGRLATCICSIPKHSQHMHGHHFSKLYSLCK